MPDMFYGKFYKNIDSIDSQEILCRKVLLH